MFYLSRNLIVAPYKNELIRPLELLKNILQYFKDYLLFSGPVGCHNLQTRTVNPPEIANHERLAEYSIKRIPLDKYIVTIELKTSHHGQNPLASVKPERALTRAFFAPPMPARLQHSHQQCNPHDPNLAHSRSINC